MMHPPWGAAQHNAWRDAYYGTLNPTPAQLTALPLVLDILLEAEKVLNARDPCAMNPGRIQAAKGALPPHWMIWEKRTELYGNIEANVLDALRPFADDMEYRMVPGSPDSGGEN